MQEYFPREPKVWLIQFLVPRPGSRAKTCPKLPSQLSSSPCSQMPAFGITPLTCNVPLISNLGDQRS